MMNEIIRRYCKEKFCTWLLYLSFFSLPLNLYLNNLIFTLFIIVFGLIKIYEGKFFKFDELRLNLKEFLIISSPFLLIVIGLIYSKEPASFRFVERMAPIILMSYYLFIDKEFFIKTIKGVFTFLLFGCLFFSISNWAIAFESIYSNSLPISVLITQDYASYNLTQVLDIHPPYAGLFLNAAIGFSVFSLHDKNRRLPTWFLLFSLAILVLFLFNLMARNAIFCFIFFAIIYFIKYRKHLHLIVFIGLLTSIIFYIYSKEENYLRDRFLKSLNFFEEETIFSKKDNRFDRLTASFEVFKQYPLFGPGSGAEDGLRREQYLLNRDVEAFNENYNAHNQFMEYLSTYGLFGGIVFMLIFFTFFKKCIRNRSLFLIYIFSCFFIATVSESLLERSWGVSFYILLFITIWVWEPKSFKSNQQNA